MNPPPPLRDQIRLPVIGAPMFLVSGPQLVVAQCAAGYPPAGPAASRPHAARVAQLFSSRMPGVEQVAFFAGAIGALGGAIAVIALRNPFYSVLALVVHLFSLAGLFLLLVASMLLMGVRSVRTLVSVAAITSAIVYGLLIWLLGSRLPRGPVEMLLASVFGG